MKKKTRIFAALLSGILLLAGCAGSSEDLNTTTVPPTVAQEGKTAASEQVDAASAEASLNSLRQAMVETPQLFAVAYFGYHDTLDSDAPVDPYAVMREQAPELFSFIIAISRIKHKLTVCERRTCECTKRT